MATVTGLTAERMIAIESASVVDGDVVGDNLILTRFDASTINAGSVRGPTGSPGITSGELADEIEAAFLLNAPIASIIETLEAVAPNALWLTMVGQTVANGETLYPVFWSKIPAAMKSGSSIVMPDTRGRVSVGLNASDVDFDTIGKTGGAKTHALSISEMAAHTHTGPSHTHTGPSHTHAESSHTHPFSATTSVVDVDHRHQGVAGRALLQASSWIETTFTEGAGGSNMKATGTPIGSLTNYMSENGGSTHSHTVSGTSGSGSGSGTGASGTGATGASGTAATGSVGSGTAHNNLQPFITFLKIVKVA